MENVAVKGSLTSHGGVIASGDESVLVNGKPVARKGDTHICPIPEHGTNSISGGCVETFIVDGQPVAHIGSVCSCGATITTGEPMKV